MQCPSVQNLLHEAFERVLTAEEKSAMDAHMNGCASCRADALLMQAMMEAIHTTPPAHPSPDFTVAVLDKLPAPIRLFGFVPAAVFRSAAVLIGAAGSAVGWIYRQEAVETARQLAATPTAGKLFSGWRHAFDGVQTLGQQVTGMLPMDALNSTEGSSATAALIAVGVALALLHMVNGFETTDEEEIEGVPEQSYT